MTTESDRPSETVRRQCHTIHSNRLSPADCELVVEEPLLIQMDDRPLATLMCTPGDEVALSLGFLCTEGIIRSREEVGAVSFCRSASGNVVRFMAAESVDPAPRLPAHRTVFSSCSICGNEALQTVAREVKPFGRVKHGISFRAVVDLGILMSRNQRFFRSTGGTHAAVLGQMERGSLLSESVILKEDIGRHNALDKVVGEALMRNVRFGQSLLFLSGRLSFEMVAKAARAGIPHIAAVSAPTSLAVELARRMNMLVVGFARGESGVVYSGRDALAD